jgi:phospholipid-binding lipoprotein MlaA
MKTTLLLRLPLLAAVCSACVTLPPGAARSPQDPWESWNRGVYRVNDVLDRHIAKPVAQTYVRVLPQPIRTGIGNFLSNLETPTVLVNDALQGKFLAAANDLGRFLLNTTLGIGGLLDPATRVGLDHNQDDFGQTLGVWGVHAGPFIELPLLGPSDLRDLPGRVVDAYTNPRQYVKNNYAKYSLWLVDFVDTRAGLLPLDETLKGVYDPYAVIRDAYLQRRAYKISGGKSTDSELVDPEAETPAPMTAPGTTPGTAPAPIPAPAPAPAQPKP